MKSINIILIGVLSIFLFSCGTQTTKTKKNLKALKGVWNLQNEKESVLGIGNNPLTLVFEPGNTENVNGFSGCNNYSATVFGSNGFINFSNLISTKMACPNLDLEQDYLDLLKQVNRFEVNRNNLYFYKDKLLLLHYKK